MSSAVAELRHALTVPVGGGHHHLQHNNPVAFAHAALQAIRDAGDPQSLFLRSILELTTQQHQQQQQNQQSDDEELLFHCITGCRQVTLWQWNRYSRAFRTRLCNFFLLLPLQQQHLPLLSRRTCRLACFTTAAALWKRSWNDDDSDGPPVDPNHPHDHPAVTPQEQTLMASMDAIGLPGLENSNDLFRYLESLSSSDNHHKMFVCACTFLECLVAEFGGPTSVSYRLPLEFHKRSHRTFQRHDSLTKTLQLMVVALRQQQRLYCVNNGPDILMEGVVVTQAMSTVLGWEFGLSAWDPGALGASALASSAKTLIRAPVEWKEYLMGGGVGAEYEQHRQLLLDLVFSWHQQVLLQQQHQQQSANSQQLEQLARNLRQLLLQLASLSGPVVGHTPEEKQWFAARLCQGTLPLLQHSLVQMDDGNNKNHCSDSSLLLDVIQLVSRLVANLRLSVLTALSPDMGFGTLLQTLTAVGRRLLEDQLRDYEAVHGNVDEMELYDWRQDVLQAVLECAVLICDDPWLRHAHLQPEQAQRSLSDVVGGPLFAGFVTCRTRMASLEEYYHSQNQNDDDDFDQVREDIMEAGMEEEMESVATLGRLHLAAAFSCLSSLFGTTIPRLQGLWGLQQEVAAGNVVTPEASALLEEARLLILYVGHLMTDNNQGESPAIPSAIMLSCRTNEALVNDLSSAVQVLLQLAHSQSLAIAHDPHNNCLSPLLAQSLLWFLHRWVPAYVYPVDYGQSRTAPRLVKEWSTVETATPIVHFCIHLCLTYQCYWPLEQSVQDSVSKLLLALARRGDEIRALMVAAPSFHDLVRFHCWTAGLRHSAPRSELEASIRDKVIANDGNADGHQQRQLDEAGRMTMVWGYLRLPYQEKARILTVILVACSDTRDETATSMIHEALGAVHGAFTSLVNTLASRQLDAEDVNVREMACLCVEMFCGVVQASEMAAPERIPQFVSGYLPQLSGLMNYYAKDLAVCETLLRFFQDYTANFISLLNREQSLVLFRASADLLKSYSANHVSSRSIKKKSSTEAAADEEQAFNDILCALRLLINLGTKDFIDQCSNSGGGVDSSEVTDVIFFGLQQILPLMTAGLLQLPNLCTVFFELVAFMVETYPEKVCVLPHELFDALLESLLFGMSHLDASIGRASLHGLANIARTHLKTRVIQQPGIFDRCTHRLLSEVVFQIVVVDRVEAAGMALLPLAAVDLNRFAAVVQELASNMSDQQHRTRLEVAFAKLLQPEAVAKVAAEGYEGRANRVKFRRDFEEFVNEIHAFLVLQ